MALNSLFCADVPLSNYSLTPKVLLPEIRTSPKYVRRHNTYVTITRTSPNHVRRQKTYVRKIRTSAEYVRQESTYVTGTHTSPISTSKCVFECSISQRCSWSVLSRNVSLLRSQTELKCSRMLLITVPLRNVRRFDQKILRQTIVGHRNILK